MPIKPRKNSVTVARAQAHDLGAFPINLRAPGYIIGNATRRCWQCGTETTVYTLGVIPPFKHLLSEKRWQTGVGFAVLSYIKWLPEDIASHLLAVTAGFFRDTSQWHARPYWMNHCQHCGAKIGDYETIESVTAPFNTAAWDLFLHVAEPFEASAWPNVRPLPKQHAKLLSPTA